MILAIIELEEILLNQPNEVQVSKEMLNNYRFFSYFKVKAIFFILNLGYKNLK